MVAGVLAEGVVATFFGSAVCPDGPVGLALWRPEDGGRQRATPSELSWELAQPAGRRIRRLRIAGSRVRVGDVLAELVALPRDADVTPSVAAWAVAAQSAVDLVARGRIRPARTPTGGAGWAAGPFDLMDR